MSAHKERNLGNLEESIPRKSEAVEKLVYLPNINKLIKLGREH